MSTTKPPVLRSCYQCGKVMHLRRQRQFADPDGRGRFCSAKCARDAHNGIPLWTSGMSFKVKRQPSIPGVDNKHLGALSEIMACEWLLRQGYEVFRNISQSGLADYVVWKPGDAPILIDVKSTAVGGKPSTKGTKAQALAGVRLLYVDREQRVISFNRQDFPGSRGPRTQSAVVRTPSGGPMPDPSPPRAALPGAEQTPP